jgi:branched-subunit amino acid ABC-type transport system permease component
VFLAQIVLNGLFTGSVYALFAVGLTMSYGVFRFINFAHGELIAWGAYGVLIFRAWPFQLPLLAAALPAVALAAAIGVASDRLVYRPLRQADRITLLVASIGLSFFLRSALVFCFGSDLASYGLGLSRGLDLGGIYVTRIQLATLGTAVCFLGGLYLLLTRTLLGKTLRAVSDNLELSGIMGLSLRRAGLTVWILSAGFAAVGGILLGLDTSLEPQMGLVNLIKAFAAVLIGGAGNVWGALLGGLFIGVAESLSVVFISPGYKDFVAFAVIILVLLVRPQGLFSLARGVR